MKNFNQLNSILQNLEQQKTSFDSIENISIQKFYVYKKNAMQKKKIKNKMKKLLCSAQDVIESYNNYKDSLIKNNSINCRKYNKLKEHAKYKRDLKLYKLGFIEKRPVLPFFQNIKFNLKKISRPLYIPFKKIHKKYVHFKSIILPQQINNIAVDIAKLGIRGYRKIKSDCCFVRRHIDSCDYAKYLNNVVAQAKFQLNKEHINCVSNNSKVSTDYKQALKYNPPSPSIVCTKKHTHNPKNSNYELSL